MKRKLSKNAKKSWVLEELVEFFIILAIFLFIKFGVSFFDITSLDKFFNEYSRAVNVIFLIMFAASFWGICIKPIFEYKQWSYMINDDEIWFREGIFWSKEVIVPIVRIQNINLKENPISKMLSIADICIGTAGGVHKIPAIDKSEVEVIMEFLREKVNENVKKENEVSYGEK